jgi:hypothetical protein
MSGKCTCIALNHDHGRTKCDREATIKGGICHECRYSLS